MHHSKRELETMHLWYTFKVIKSQLPNTKGRAKKGIIEVNWHEHCMLSLVSNISRLFIG